jgi:hypothetical protein
MQVPTEESNAVVCLLCYLVDMMISLQVFVDTWLNQQLQGCADE